MCYYFINYVIKSVGERFASLCWCRLKSGGDLIFASNLPGDRVYGKVGGVFCRIVAYVFVCLCCFYCCVFYYFAVVVVVFVKIPPLLVERVGGECCDNVLFVVVLMWLLRPPQTFSTCFCLTVMVCGV